METFSNLLNAAVVAGAVAVAALAPAPTTPHNGFACVRPSYVDTLVLDGGTPHTAKVFAGYRLCHEQLPVDKDGYLVFPEA